MEKKINNSIFYSKNTDDVNQLVRSLPGRSVASAVGGVYRRPHRKESFTEAAPNFYHSYRVSLHNFFLLLLIR
jgi:hypothetical protein